MRRALVRRVVRGVAAADAALGPPLRALVTTRPTLDDRGILVLGLAGAATLFLVQPPADAWPLAWLAPLPWLAV
ncbi:MAG: hypothetical protein EBX36_12175, partial [Planctomycetia bacterium]|nr:hypothetical protein [Planctomycetia bacterium]